MGVSGSGKTTVGKMLSSETGMNFIDGDDHHPKENVQKMSQGIPLNDEDRIPWLKELNTLARENLPNGCIIGCSSLKNEYRNLLADTIESNVLWVYLKGSFEQIFARMNKRENHYMGSNMLQSQFDTLEEPENALVVDISDAPEIIIKKIKTALSHAF